MRDGAASAFIGVAGNFVRAMSDSGVTEAALRRCRLTVQISTELNRSHTVCGDIALILPPLGRSDRDVQASGEQFVTVEDSMSEVASPGHAGGGGADGNQSRWSRDDHHDAHPGDDFDLAVGFLVSEGVVRRTEDVRAPCYCALATVDGGSTCNVVDIDPSMPALDVSLERNFYTTSSCGLCGKAVSTPSARPARGRSPTTRCASRSGAGAAAGPAPGGAARLRQDRRPARRGPVRARQ
jgi:hypothetical protein